MSLTTLLASFTLGVTKTPGHLELLYIIQSVVLWYLKSYTWEFTFLWFFCAFVVYSFIVSSSKGRFNLMRHIIPTDAIFHFSLFFFTGECFLVHDRTKTFTILLFVCCLSACILHVYTCRFVTFVRIVVRL